jgi:Holliday junction resolvasome RuvABC endonuclease subunit
VTDRVTVCGLDLSLTSTGISTACGGLLAAAPVFRALRPPPKLKTWDRMEWLIAALGREVKAADPDVILVEGPGYHSAAKGSYWHENAGLWWEATLRIRRSGVPMAVLTPGTLKKFATGNGSAKKSAMVGQAMRRFELDDIGEDEADSLWLAAAGCEHYGWPVVKLPAAQVAALDVVTWPVLQDPEPEPVPV